MIIQLEKYIENMNLRKFNTTKEYIIKNCNTSYQKIRDIIVNIGKIIDENEIEQIYVFTIQSGKLGNEAVVVIGLQGENVYMKAYAKEGLFNQYTCERALNQISEAIK